MTKVTRKAVAILPAVHSHLCYASLITKDTRKEVAIRMAAERQNM